MGYIQPTSEVWLCANVPLDPSYDNQLTFTSGSGTSRVWNVTAQRAYFASKAVYHPQNFSIVKERDGVLRMSGEVSNYYGINYMYFVNPPFGTGITSKYFYAFVTQVEYINPNTTFIYFELDYFQTWAGEIEWMESSIEREHVEHDEMYANLENENIEVNDLEPYQDVYLDGCLGQKILVIGATESYQQMIETVQNEGLKIFYFPYDKDYPIYKNEYIHKKKEKLDSRFFCFKDNQSVGYSRFSYNQETGEIIIVGLQDVSIDTIIFSLELPNVSEKWFVKGVRTGAQWAFSQDGIRVGYNPVVDYPQNVIAGDFPTWNYPVVCYVDSTEYRPNRYEYETTPANYWLIGGVPSTVNKFTFSISLSSTEFYNVLATKNGSTWTFEDGS